MSFIKRFYLPIIIFLPFFVYGQTENVIKVSKKTIPPMVSFCAGGGDKCAPEISFATTTATTTSTTTKKYILPKEGVRIKSVDANFTFFKPSLGWNSGRNVLVVSRKWQTACLYNSNGEIMKISTTTNKYVCFQSATGRKEFPTELGLYNIQTKYKKDYTSTFYSNTGRLQEGETGAPMPFAMHIGRIIGKTLDNKVIYDFSDGTAIHEKQTVNRYGSVSFVSHGCIAVEKGKGEYLQSVMSYGDFVLIINESFPNTLDEAISINK